MDAFAGAVSHDLQAPLRVIRGYAEALQERTLDDEARRFVDSIARSGERMQQMITELLEYARVGQNERGESADAGVALRRALDNLAMDLRASGAQVTHGALPRVQMPWQRLTQVFQNLVDNAIRFRQPGVPPVIEVSAEVVGAAVQFSVRDNGIGVDPRYLPRIFELFTHARPAGDRAGVGMGLAICKRIVEHHGGRIWVQSTPGDGANFVFECPTSGDS